MAGSSLHIAGYELRPPSNLSHSRGLFFGKKPSIPA